ncbi:hypothetical protein MKX03_007181 [Papaver bracteatum]|nr:hypothetical protein MKX03_007181 [Papaver bracteatum]
MLGKLRTSDIRLTLLASIRAARNYMHLDFCAYMTSLFWIVLVVVVTTQKTFISRPSTNYLIGSSNYPQNWPLEIETKYMKQTKLILIILNMGREMFQIRHNQGSPSLLPNGIPTYTIEIMNVCVSGCDISRIYLSCGWFSSSRLINPRLFKRIRYNDCIVNDGKPLPNAATLSFRYANTFRYPISVSSVTC